MTYTPAQREANTSSWTRREMPRHTTNNDEEWDHLLGETDEWSAMAEQCKADSIRLRTEVTNNYHRSTNILDAMQRMRDRIERLRPRKEGRSTPEHSPRALASQALYAERGPAEEPAEYQRRKGAQARFETSRPPAELRIEEVEDYSSSPYPGMEEQSTSSQRYARQMAESRARTAWKRPHGRTSGPPLRNEGRNNEGPARA